MSGYTPKGNQKKTKNTLLQIFLMKKMAQVCAHKYEIARLGSLNFQISQIVYISSIVATFIFSYFAIKIVQRKSIFQFSTKLLLIQSIFSANLHQVFYGFAAIDRLYKAFFRLNDPCIPLHVESECVIFLEILVAGISGMIYGQTGLLIERACATFLKNYEKKKSLLTGILISFIVLVLSASTGRIIVWDDPLNNYQLSCNSFPRQSSERSATFFSMCTIISLFNLLMSILIRKYNQKFEYSTPFVVGPRFRKREVIDSTSTICFLAFVQFVFMFIYSFGIFMLKTFRSNFTYEEYYFWVVWCYTIPFTAALFPILLVYRIRSSHFSRIMIIKSFTNAKQTQEDHIKQMKNVWN